MKRKIPRRGNGKTPQPEDGLLRNAQAREEQTVRQIRDWYFDEHRSREWIAEQLPDRDPVWIWKIIRHDIFGWLS